ncbi:SGNH/GDSL hydrolase family protein [Leptospira gomenensis]|uniref:SGNH/GDSL hydrolase family protein n=1 Tax=Leptospira gomenensis TaxID=2484974 RepID=A0A5F1YAF9_9LEPT|nr:SGNH/GDSL hydrolase family protein [Leptospira gomenensis]TGK33854.1 SGNH/GDSL hydrolase family protein [Leptospira gomenensis]TGK36309.1 SGNH/GDSL hydrolase family protein [Leptospira gomenensis]TGK52079.1 SGNH/GDSL hydrolase family protein [Leptospira gomenensis]TGK59872.1 SGNH/GDSL hydrolase family protein [Leptospira gomenensis]
MKEYVAFFKDSKFWIPVLVLILIETGMQFGCYRPFLKKNSYAANVSRITNHVIDKQKEFDPDVLIVGTSVAYQGLSLPILNRELAPLGKKVQSIAIPGTELIVQDLAVLKTLPHFKNVKTVVHVFEITTPWVGQKILNLHTLAMISEFDRLKVYPRIYDFGYKVEVDDLAYITLKSIAYRRDIQDLILGPSKRIKDIGKRFKTENADPWDYENSYREKISMYSIKDVPDCVEKTNPANGLPFPEGSDRFHKKAIFDTCVLSSNPLTDAREDEITKQYFDRLKILHDEIRRIGRENGQEIEIIGVVAPYSQLIQEWRLTERNEVWKRELNRIHPEHPVPLLDYQTLLDGPNNGDYYYDLIHLNRIGMEKLTYTFSKDLKSILSKEKK